ncbi:PREDICTED: uncharacterized protein LOC105146384 [Acromyrmex echinatior]|uniref:uncharacterized protein LOC105146384 n=1 Tax=Acromyrmex echinatior TaxID=103372 RepID=UPI0005810790|nr:PREDICTED: uncharacterized protein LOC105146384 [Acromyrmex echinatior]
MYEFVLEMSLTSVLTVPSSLIPPAFSYVSLLSCVTRLTVAAYACVRGCVFGHQESVLRWWSTTSSSACLPHRATTMCFLRRTVGIMSQILIMTPGPSDVRRMTWCRPLCCEMSSKFIVARIDTLPLRVVLVSQKLLFFLI